MQWKVVTDSGCDIPEKIRNRTEVPYESVAFSITEEKTSCPSPAAWLAAYAGAEQVIVVTMSGALSGSCRSAAVAREIYLEQHPECCLYVLDSRMAGPGIGLLVYGILEDIHQGKSYEQVVADARLRRKNIQMIFALSSFENLVRAGRIHRLMGYAADRLGLTVIGTGNREGRIELLHRVRGAKRVYGQIVHDMEKRQFTGGDVWISHCYNRRGAALLAHSIQEKWPEAKVIVRQTGEICSHYAEKGGLIVAFSCDI